MRLACISASGKVSAPSEPRQANMLKKAAQVDSFDFIYYCSDNNKAHLPIMEHALSLFGNKLPTLAELKAHNKGRDVAPETAWIWGDDDEVRWGRSPQRTDDPLNKSPQVGRLNLLTPSRIQAVRDQELRNGEVVSLK